MTKRPAHLPDLWVLTHVPGYAHRDARDLFQRTMTPSNRRVVVTHGGGPEISFPAHQVAMDRAESLPGDWWSAGLEWISSHYVSEHDIWDVLMVEASVLIDPATVDILRDHMRFLDCAMAGADNQSSLSDASYLVIRGDEEETYMPRGAFVVSGELGIRHDPALTGLMQEYDFELRHRRLGGAVRVGGTRSFHIGGTLPPRVNVREIVSSVCSFPSYREKIL